MSEGRPWADGHGYQKGDHVSVWTTNVPEWIYLQFALGMVGGVLVTINTNYRSHELEYILKQSDSTTLFLIDAYRDVSFYDTARTVMPQLDHCPPGQLQSAKLPKMKNVVYIGDRKETPGMFSFSAMLEMADKVTDSELDERMSSLSDDDVINMQYTSGTTGFPKGSHAHASQYRQQCPHGRGRDGDDRKDKLLIQVPVFHCFGCVMSTLNCVYHASTMVVLEYFDAGAALEAIASEKCTAINGVPTMFVNILNHPDFSRYDMTSLRTGIMAGAPVRKKR